MKLQQKYRYPTFLQAVVKNRNNLLHFIRNYAIIVTKEKFWNLQTVDYQTIATDFHRSYTIMKNITEVKAYGKTGLYRSKKTW